MKRPTICNMVTVNLLSIAVSFTSVATGSEMSPEDTGIVTVVRPLTERQISAGLEPIRRYVSRDLEAQQQEKYVLDKPKSAENFLGELAKRMRKARSFVLIIDRPLIVEYITCWKEDQGNICPRYQFNRRQETTKEMLSETTGIVAEVKRLDSKQQSAGAQAIQQYISRDIHAAQGSLETFLSTEEIEILVRSAVSDLEVLLRSGADLTFVVIVEASPVKYTTCWVHSGRKECISYTV